jgi:hypothetical protein
MSRRIRFCLTLLLLGFGPAILAQPASDSASPPATVILNGLVSIFGDQQACLQISRPGSPPENVLLAAGRTFRDIRLLAVDVSASAVRINNGGQLQTLKICAAPEVTAGDDSWTPPVPAHKEMLPRSADTGQLVANSPVKNDGVAGLGGNPANPLPNLVKTPATTSAGGQAGNNNSASSGSAANSGASTTGSPINSTPVVDNQNNQTSASGNLAGAAGATSPSPATTHVYYWWTSVAEGIEQARQANAAAVLAGDMRPEPLTPLTPPTTPAALIDLNTSLFFEHGRGLVVSNSN